MSTKGHRRKSTAGLPKLADTRPRNHYAVVRQLAAVDRLSWLQYELASTSQQSALACNIKPPLRPIVGVILPIEMLQHLQFSFVAVGNNSVFDMQHHTCESIEMNEQEKILHRGI
jgi:hypothetical protein